MSLTDKEIQSLIETANGVRTHAYAPYSQYAVGAALRTKLGHVYTGVNIENAAYPTGICAERVAVFKAVSEGEVAFDVIAVVTDNGGSPCGSCRQVLAEFGLDTVVLIADGNGKLTKTMTVGELLPEAFQPHDLGVERGK
jgi:cytidine deaminase